jgi:hypothetical protein
MSQKFYRRVQDPSNIKSLLSAFRKAVAHVSIDKFVTTSSVAAFNVRIKGSRIAQVFVEVAELMSDGKTLREEAVRQKRKQRLIKTAVNKAFAEMPHAMV